MSDRSDGFARVSSSSAATAGAVLPAGSGGLFGAVFARGGAVADDGAWLRAMLAAEAGLARAVERAGLAPVGAGAAVNAAVNAVISADSGAGTAGAGAESGAGTGAGGFDIAELGRSVTLVGNPVPGLARALARIVGSPDAAVAVHQGATSQDIMDTAAMLLARDAIDRASADLASAAAATARIADAHRSTLMIGRMGLQQAVPVTFGMVAAGWLSGLDGVLDGLAWVRSSRLAVQLGGAGGTLASLGDRGARVKSLLAQELGLADPPLPWHTERLRVIDVATAMARVLAALSKIARDVTLLSQTEIAEVREGTPETVRRAGLPMMPRQADPVASVAILGCARQAPGLLATVIAAAEQEQQRAAGAWQAEWQPYGQLLQLAASAAAWARELLAGLRVDSARMAANLAAAGGIPLAERVVALLSPSLGGARAHDVVATAAARAVSSGVPLRDVLLAAPEIAGELAQAGIGQEQVDRVLDPVKALGSSGDFIAAAIRAHREPPSPERSRG